MILKKFSSLIKEHSTIQRFGIARNFFDDSAGLMTMESSHSLSPRCLCLGSSFPINSCTFFLKVSTTSSKTLLFFHLRKTVIYRIVRREILGKHPILAVSFDETKHCVHNFFETIFSFAESTIYPNICYCFLVKLVG